MLFSYTMVAFLLFYDGAVDIQIWALLTKSQCKISDTQVTVKACGSVFLCWRAWETSKVDFCDVFNGIYFSFFNTAIADQSTVDIFLIYILYCTHGTKQWCCKFLLVAFSPNVFQQIQTHGIVLFTLWLKCFLAPLHVFIPQMATYLTVINQNSGFQMIILDHIMKRWLLPVVCHSGLHH